MREDSFDQLSSVLDRIATALEASNQTRLSERPIGTVFAEAEKEGEMYGPDFKIALQKLLRVFIQERPRASVAADFTRHYTPHGLEVFMEQDSRLSFDRNICVQISACLSGAGFWDA